jgi:hypothetical protein
MRCSGHLTHIGDVKMHTEFLVRKSEEKRNLWGSMQKWKDNIRTDIKEMGGGGVCFDWINQVKVRGH